MIWKEKKEKIVIEERERQFEANSIFVSFTLLFPPKKTKKKERKKRLKRIGYVFFFFFFLSIFLSAFNFDRRISKKAYCNDMITEKTMERRRKPP